MRACVRRGVRERSRGGAPALEPLTYPTLLPGPDEAVHTCSWAARDVRYPLKCQYRDLLVSSAYCPWHLDAVGLRYLPPPTGPHIHVVFSV